MLALTHLAMLAGFLSVSAFAHISLRIRHDLPFGQRLVAVFVAAVVDRVLVHRASGRGQLFVPTRVVVVILREDGRFGGLAAPLRPNAAVGFAFLTVRFLDASAASLQVLFSLHGGFFCFGHVNIPLVDRAYWTRLKLTVVGLVTVTTYRVATGAFAEAAKAMAVGVRPAFCEVIVTPVPKASALAAVVPWFEIVRVHDRLNRFGSPAMGGFTPAPKMNSDALYAVASAALSAEMMLTAVSVV